jgi:hypothetical protein
MLRLQLPGPALQHSMQLISRAGRTTPGPFSTAGGPGSTLGRNVLPTPYRQGLRRKARKQRLTRPREETRASTESERLRRFVPAPVVGSAAVVAGLLRRTQLVRVRTEDAAITRQWLEHRLTRRARVEELTSVGRHGLGRRGPALRTGDGRFKGDRRHVTIVGVVRERLRTVPRRLVG